MDEESHDISPEELHEMAQDAELIADVREAYRFAIMDALHDYRKTRGDQPPSETDLRIIRQQALETGAAFFAQRADLSDWNSKEPDLYARKVFRKLSAPRAADFAGDVFRMNIDALEKAMDAAQEVVGEPDSDGGNNGLIDAVRGYCRQDFARALLRYREQSGRVMPTAQALDGLVKWSLYRAAGRFIADQGSTAEATSTQDRALAKILRVTLARQDDPAEGHAPTERELRRLFQRIAPPCLPGIIRDLAGMKNNDLAHEIIPPDPAQTSAPDGKTGKPVITDELLGHCGNNAAIMSNVVRCVRVAAARTLLDYRANTLSNPDNAAWPDFLGTALAAGASLFLDSIEIEVKGQILPFAAQAELFHSIAAEAMLACATDYTSKDDLDLKIAAIDPRLDLVQGDKAPPKIRLPVIRSPSTLVTEKLAPDYLEKMVRRNDVMMNIELLCRHAKARSLFAWRQDHSGSEPDAAALETVELDALFEAAENFTAYHNIPELEGNLQWGAAHTIFMALAQPVMVKRTTDLNLMPGDGLADEIARLGLYALNRPGTRASSAQDFRQAVGFATKALREAYKTNYPLGEIKPFEYKPAGRSPDAPIIRIL